MRSTIPSTVEVELGRELVADRFEEPVDVVALRLGAAMRTLFQIKSLDVKRVVDSLLDIERLETRERR